MAFGLVPEKELAKYCNEISSRNHLELGKLYLETQQHENALAQFNQVKSKDPNPDLYTHKAKAYNQLGNKEKAYDMLIEALGLSADVEAQEMLDQISKQLNVKENAREKIWKKRFDLAKPAAEFTLSDMKGNSVSLKDFRGKVVLINFWYPLCGPCQMELPHIQKIYDKYKDQEFEVLLIQVAQTKEEGKKSLEEHNYTMTSLFSDARWARDNYGVEACPTNFFIDRKGRIIFKSTGYTPGIEKEIEAKIKELIEFDQ
jgi:peroxiredoxin